MLLPWGLTPGWSFLFLIVFSILLFYIVKLALRHISILIRGWPPEHIDADGDSVELMIKKAQLDHEKELYKEGEL